MRARECKLKMGLFNWCIRFESQNFAYICEKKKFYANIFYKHEIT